jgi:hypothetical protein
MTASI